MSTTALAPSPPAELSADVKESILLNGDLSRLKPAERVQYMLTVCQSLGLNPLTKPFEFITLNSKLVMYARRECTEQLRKIHGVSIRITAREVMDDVYVVTAQATDREGRCDESTGAVPIGGLKGEPKANAFLKAETKAKRRVTLSISGLGMLDESEVEAAGGQRLGKSDVDAHFDRLAQERAAPKAPAPSAPSTATSAAPATSGGEAPAASTAEGTDEKLPPGEPMDLVECWSWKHISGSAKNRNEVGEWVTYGVHEKRSLAQNARLHALRQELGISDETWRSRLAANFNKESSAELSVAEADDLIEKLEARRVRHGTAADKRQRQNARAAEAAEEMAEYVDEPLEPGSMG